MVKNVKFSAKFLDEHKNIGRFSNLHWCTFNANILFLKNSKQNEENHLPEQ